tara:strand:+ start:43940 stop:44530 length:591 start_codon:yes stop_codon:yes gene_type:complete
MNKKEYLDKLCDSQSFLKNYIRSHIAGEQNVEDILQDANIKIIEKYSSYKDEGKFTLWVKTFAFWTIRSYKKKAWSRSSVSYCGDIMSEENVALFDYSEEAEVFSSRRETEKMLEELEKPLKELLPDHAQVFRLMLKGYKPAEIAQQTKKSVVSIYKIRTRGLQALKEKIQQKRNMKKLKKGVDLWGKHLTMESEN